MTCIDCIHLDDEFTDEDPCNSCLKSKVGINFEPRGCISCKHLPDHPELSQCALCLLDFDEGEGHSEWQPR